MFFLWGKTGGEEILDKGYLDCPRCQSRQPAVITTQVESSHIYFIPISSSTGPEQVRCETCGRYYPNNEHTAFGHEEKMPDWNCFKCKKPIPYAKVDCPHCGFRFATW